MRDAPYRPHNACRLRLWWRRLRLRFARRRSYDVPGTYMLRWKGKR